MVGIGSWWGRVGKKEAVLRRGERRQTHMRSFSRCTKLPSKILPWYGPADPFTYMSNKSFPKHDKPQPNYNNSVDASL